MPSRISSYLAVCLSAACFVPASQESLALEDAALKPGHVLFAVEGTAARVDMFFDAYMNAYNAAGSSLREWCGQANRIYVDASYYVVFLCNPNSAVFPTVNPIFDGVKPPSGSNSELLSMTVTNTLESRNPNCSPMRCKYQGHQNQTCTYYQCPIDPWCYHTGQTYACVGAHKCKIP